MKISNLAKLLSGKVPMDYDFKKLNADSKKSIKQFINKIPLSYSVSDIQKDIKNFSAPSNKKLLYLVEDGIPIGLFIASIVVFILYWIIFNFWVGLISGLLILVMNVLLEKRLVDVFGISQESKRLYNDYEKLKNDLIASQKNK